MPSGTQSRSCRTSSLWFHHVCVCVCMRECMRRCGRQGDVCVQCVCSCVWVEVYAFSVCASRCVKEIRADEQEQHKHAGPGLCVCGYLV